MNTVDVHGVRKQKNDKLRTCVYIDYENIYKRLQDMSLTPTQIRLIEGLKEHLSNNQNLEIVSTLVYCNFERNDMYESRHQSQLHKLGVKTRHTSNDGKNSADLEMAVDALKVLYRQSDIEVFVLVSSDRDMIPLIDAIREENKIAYVISTKHGFNTIVAEHADLHEYIDDLFHLEPQSSNTGAAPEEGTPFDTSSLREDDITRIKMVCSMFYVSKFWSRFKAGEGEAVSLNGYASSLATKLQRMKQDIIVDFKAADALGYVKLYHDSDKDCICIGQGDSYPELSIEADTEIEKAKN